MTSKIVVNNIEADSGINTVTFNSNISGNLIGNVTGNVNSTGVTTTTTLRATSIVGVTTAGITTAYIGSVNDGPISGFRNRIINGSMDIFQRRTAATIGASSVYALDRWLFGREAGTESARFTVTQEALTSSDAPFAVGITTTMKIDVTAASGGISAAQSHYVMQRIEGYNVSDLSYGSSVAKSSTLSFWMKTDVKTGTMAVSLFNAATRYYVQSVEASTSWTKYSLTFPGDTSGSIPNSNAQGLQVMFVLSAGSNLQGTANAWTAGFKNSLSGQADFTDSTSNNIYITGVQLEPGTVTTPFEKRSIGQELELCQRYYYRVDAVDFGGGGPIFGSGANANTTTSIIWTPFPVPMRTSPSSIDTTGTASDYSIIHVNTSIVCSAVPSIDDRNRYGCRTNLTVSSGLTAGQGSFGRLATTGTSFVGFNAEL